MLLYLSSKHSNVILNVSIKKYIYYNEIYSIPAKSQGIMTIPAEPGPGQNRLILAETGILPGNPGRSLISTILHMNNELS